MSDYPRDNRFEEEEHHGFACVVRTSVLGNKSGFIGLPKGHPLHGVHHSEVAESVNPWGGFNHSFLDDHGTWWLRWDDDYEDAPGGPMQECRRLTGLIYDLTHRERNRKNDLKWLLIAQIERLAIVAVVAENNKNSRSAWQALDDARDDLHRTLGEIEGAVDRINTTANAAISRASRALGVFP